VRDGLHEQDAGAEPGKIADLFRSLWNLRVTPGGVNHAIQSLGSSCKADYLSIVDAIGKAAQVTCDETGWRVGGRGHWLHPATTADLCAYVTDAGRGKRATDRLIGENFSAQRVHDGWAP
jgi:transposase